MLMPFPQHMPRYEYPAGRHPECRPTRHPGARPEPHEQRVQARTFTSVQWSRRPRGIHPAIAGAGVGSGPCFLRSREQVSDCAATDAALRIDKTRRFTCAAHLQIRYLYEHTGTRPGSRWVGRMPAPRISRMRGALAEVVISTLYSSRSMLNPAGSPVADRRLPRLRRIPALLEFSPAPGQWCARGRSLRNPRPAAGPGDGPYAALRLGRTASPVAEFQPALSARIWPHRLYSAVRAGYRIMSPTARAQQLVPKRERVFSGGHDAGAYRLLDRGQQRGRCFADHFGRVVQTERGAEHRRGH